MADHRHSDTDVSPEEKIVAPHEHDEKFAIAHDEKVVAKHPLDSEAGPGRQAVALNLVENPLKVSCSGSVHSDIVFYGPATSGGRMIDELTS